MRGLPSYAICIGPFADDLLDLVILPGGRRIVGASVGDRLTMCIPNSGRHRRGSRRRLGFDLGGARHTHLSNLRTRRFGTTRRPLCAIGWRCRRNANIGRDGGLRDSFSTRCGQFRGSCRQPGGGRSAGWRNLPQCARRCDFGWWVCEPDIRWRRGGRRSRHALRRPCPTRGNPRSGQFRSRRRHRLSFRNWICGPWRIAGLNILRKVKRRRDRFRLRPDIRRMLIEILRDAASRQSQQNGSSGEPKRHRWRLSLEVRPEYTGSVRNSAGARPGSIHFLHGPKQPFSCVNELAALVEWRGGISPPRSPRTGRESLNSYGSRHPAVCHIEAASARRALGWS